MRVEDLQIQRNIYPLDPIKRPPVVEGGHKVPEGVDSPEQSFSELLKGKLQESPHLKFSNHAIDRLNQRQIDISPSALERLEQGVRNVAEKGGRSSLILVDENAYIVSVNNKTVVTAMPKESSIGNVFTQIDSVAIV